MCVGADVRLLQPSRTVLGWAATSEAGSVQHDAAFEGFTADRRVGLFTPDLIIAYATPRMQAFVARMLRELQLADRSAERSERLRGVGQDDVGGTHKYERLQRMVPLYSDALLTGPAQQDLLWDVFVSHLYNQTLWARKRCLARKALRLRIADGCLGASVYSTPTGVLNLPTLDARPGRHGTVLSTRRLTALLTDGVGMRTHAQPCLDCGWYRKGASLAIHCGGKHPGCLNLSACRCVARGARR